MGDVDGDSPHRRRHNHNVGPQLLRAEHIPEPADEQEVIEVEVHAEQQHENADDHIEIGALIGAHAQVPAAEAAGAGGAEGMDAGIEQGHAAQQQKDDLNDGHDQIDAVEDLGRIAHAADQLAHGRAGHLRPQKVHAVAVAHGQDGHDEHQHAHAAHPVGEAAPEQAAASQ